MDTFLNVLVPIFFAIGKREHACAGIFTIRVSLGFSAVLSNPRDINSPRF
jgi:hypothetical protein